MDLVLLATSAKSSAIRGCMPDHVCCVVLESAESIKKAFQRYRPCGIIVTYDDALAGEMDTTTFAALVESTQPVSCPILLYSAAESDLAQKLSSGGFSVITRSAFNAVECRAIVKDWQKRRRAR